MIESNDIQRRQDPSSLTYEISWIGAGFIQPLYKLNYYRRAIGRRTIHAVVFFSIFGLLLTLISTINLARILASVNNDIEQAFADGQFPEIIIQDGIAEVKAEQPLILFEDNETIAIIDTTGTYHEIDRSRYAEGFLLTRNTLHVYSEGEYQFISLSDLHELFNTNPLVLNQKSALELWRGFTAIFSIVAFIGLSIWNLIVRFMFLTFLGVVFWGIASLFRLRTDFRAILILGIYALVPAIYARFVLGQIGISFFGLLTLLSVVMWGWVVWRTQGPQSEDNDAETPALVR